MNKGSLFESNRFLLAAIFTLGLSLAFCQQISTKSGPKADESESIMVGDVASILNYADAELEDSATFLTGLDDIRLVVGQHDVAKALKTNNKVESQVRKLKLPSKVAGLMKKAFKATRKADGVGAEHKEEVAKLLVEVYGVWSDEDALQKLNFERWSDQIFDEMNIDRSDRGQEEEDNDAAEAVAQKVVTKKLDADKESAELLTRLPEGAASERDAREQRAKKLRKQRASGQNTPNGKPKKKPRKAQAAQSPGQNAAPIPGRRKKRPVAEKQTAAWEQEKPGSKKKRAKAQKGSKKEGVAGPHAISKHKPKKDTANKERKGRVTENKVKLSREKNERKASSAPKTQPTSSTRSL